MSSSVASLCAFAVASALGIQVQDSALYGRVARPKFKKVSSAAQHLVFEYPDSKDWRILPGQAQVLAIVAETKNGDASIVLERTALREALTDEDLPTARDSEADTIRENQPNATQLRQQVMKVENRQFIVVQYVRPGINGEEQVVHYAFPIGSAIYRVICSSPVKEFAKYAPIFGHVAASLQVSPGS